MAVNLKYVNEMVQHATSNGFTVTSTTGGQHNTGSKHAKGLAIDVRTRDKTPQEITTFIKHMQGLGYKVLDERVRPPKQKVWGGPHLHIEIIDPTIIKAVAASSATVIVLLLTFFF